ncbi:MAG: hypothetical protein R8K48_08710, partial [Gallionella sp.]
FDDLYFFMLDREGHSAIEQFANPAWLDLRALPYATLAWNAQLFGFDLPPFRIENLLLHGLVVIALALFVLRLYRSVLADVPNSEKTRMNTAVFIAVSLFALNPVAVYAVAYLVQRSIVMATLFAVLALWTYLKGSHESRKGWLWVSVALYFLATHSKEHVIMLPAVLVAMTVLLHEDWRARLRANWLIFFAYAVIALVTFYQIRYVLGKAYAINASDMFDGKIPEQAYLYSILTQSGLFFKYGVLWVLPNPAWMSVDMREPFAQGFFSVYGAALIAWLAYGVLACRLLFLRGRRGLIGFALLFPWLMYLTEFSTVRIQEIFVLYRSYIWALGGVMLLPLLLMKLNARLTLMVSVLLAATLFMVSMERLSSFSNAILLWDDAEKLIKDRQALPGVGRIYYNRGTEWLKADRYDLALSDLQKATRLSPNLSAGFGNLGATYLKLSQNKRAVEAFDHAIYLDETRKSPPNYKNYYGRGSAFEAQTLWLKAAADYKVSCALTGKVGCDKINLPDK